MCNDIEIANKICESVSFILNVDSGKLYGKDRSSLVNTARMLAVYICHIDYEISAGTLAKLLRRTSRDVFYLCNKMKSNIETYKNDNDLYKSVSNQVKTIF